jgi:peptidoglycan-associated lipoprotein
MTKYHTITFCALLAAGILGQGCTKKVATAPPPTPQAAPAPTASTPAAVPTPRSAPERTPVASAPEQRGPDAATRRRIEELLARIEDAYFDYDRHALRPDAQQALRGNSTELRNILKDYPDYKLTIEGYCDERGSAEYNIGLGDARAKAAKDYLVQVGIPDGQLAVLSYGKEKQVCQEHDESCWQKNRRVHIVAAAR